MNLEDFLNLETESGVKVRDLELLNGHYLVYKIPVEEIRSILLPDFIKRKSIKNIVMIRGLVIKTSLPFYRKRSERYYKWDPEGELMAPKWRIKEGCERIPSEIKEGDGIIYMSYNVGYISVGLPEPLVIVRDIDIISTFPAAQSKRINLPDKAYRCSTA